MDPLVLAILKSLATTCVKLYFTHLVGSSSIAYQKSDLGYTIPKWYMNPGIIENDFYAYGTSTEGDEFQSLEAARKQALSQMAETIRLTKHQIIKDHIRFDQDNLKQRRLVELFAQDEGLETFLKANTTQDKQELVKVTKPQTDLRAFIRINLESEVYFKQQETWLNDLKRRLMQQKTEDIMAELESDLKTFDTPAEPEIPANQAPLIEDPPVIRREIDPPPERRPTTGAPSAVDQAFDELDGANP